MTQTKFVRKIMGGALAVCLTFSLASPAITASAWANPEEQNASSQSENINASSRAALQEASAEGFDIQNGVLVSYSGSDTNVTVPSGVTTIGNGSKGVFGSSVTSVSLPDTVTKIAAKGFYGSYGLKNGITLPSSLVEIGSNAFDECYFAANTTIELPASVTTVGSSAFAVFGEGVEGCKLVVRNPQASLGDDIVPYYSSVTIVGEKGSTAEAYVNKVKEAKGNSCKLTFSTQDAQDEPQTVAVEKVAFINGASQTLEVGGSSLVIATVTPRDATDKTLTYESSNPSVVSVEQNGLVRALAPGKVTITAKAGGKSDTCTIEVIPVVAKEEFDIQNGTLVAYNGTDTEVNVPGEVKTIGDGTKAVFGSSVTKVVLPQGLTTIAANAFKNSNITSLELPESVTSIGDSAFSKTKFKTLVMPKSLKSIGNSAFWYSELQNVQLNEGLETIGDSAFSLTRVCGVTIPSSVVSIGSEAFDYEYHENMKMYVVFKGSGTQLQLTSIPYYYDLAVYAPTGSAIETYVKETQASKTTSCKMTFHPLEEFVALDSMTLSETRATLKRQEELALSIVKNPENALFESIIWTSSQPEVASVSDKGVVKALRSGQTTITATSGTVSATCVVTVKVEAGESDFTINENGQVTGYLGGETSWTIPGTIEGKTVTGIADGAFVKNKTVTSVVLPTSCVSIGTKAFADCENLASINLSSVTSLGTSAFENTGLASIELGKGLAKVPESAFARCASLTQVKLPETVKRLDKNSFSSCSSLKNLPLNEGLESIGEGALRSTPLTSLHFPSTFKQLGDSNVGDPFEIGGKQIADKSMKTVTVSADNPRYASEDGLLYTKDKKTLVFCPRGRTSITVANGCEKIGDYSCFMCFDLETVNLPSSLKVVGKGAFQYGEGIKSMELPEGLETVEQSGFFGCENWTGVDRLPSTLRNLGSYSFAECLGSKLTIPEGVTDIPEFAFWGYEDGLKEINLPSTLKTIAKSAFSWAKDVESLKIPEGVTSIGNEAFARLDALKSVSLPSTLTTIGDRAFMGKDGSNALATFYVPENVANYGEEVLLHRESTQVTALEGSVAWNTLKAAGINVKAGVAPVDDKKKDDKPDVNETKIAVSNVAGNTGIKAQGFLSGKNIPENATVELSAQEIAKSDSHVTLKQALSNGQTLGIYEISMMVNGKQIHDGFGSFTLVFPVDAAYNGRALTVLHLHQDGTLTQEKKFVQNGQVSVTVSDLSTFALSVQTGQAANESSDTNNDVTPASYTVTSTKQTQVGTGTTSTTGSSTAQTGDVLPYETAVALGALACLAAVFSMLCFAAPRRSKVLQQAKHAKRL